MNQAFREYVEKKLPLKEDKELFRDLLEAYYKGGPDEVKKQVQSIIKEISGA